MQTVVKYAYLCMMMSTIVIKTAVLATPSFRPRRGFPLCSQDFQNSMS